MYVQVVKNKSKDGKKVYTSYLIKESYRTEKGPRSRTVCNITSLPPETREAIRKTLKGEKFVSTDSIKLEDARDFGGMAVLKDAWKRFKLDQVFAHVQDQRSRQLLQAMIFARILFPSSKRSLFKQAQQTVLASACGLNADENFDEEDLYEAMDALNSSWVSMEKELYDKQEQSPSVVLYDLTSVYFEGDGPEGLAQYGYSRDHRGDRKQILIAVATDAQGIPLHVEVLRGNRGDNTTLLGLLTTMKRRFGIKEAIFCFDGGMSSKFNLEKMQQEQLHYVTRQSDATFKSLLEKLPEDKQPELWDCTDLMEFTVEGKRYVVAGSPERKYRDRQRRQYRIEKAKAELQRLKAVKRRKVDRQKLASQVGRTLQRLQAHKYFDYYVDESDQIQWNLKEDVLAGEEALDGTYLLHTSLDSCDHSKESIHQHYKNLMSVEDAFRSLKSYLEVRPIFHYRPDRVRNHVRICFMAHWLKAKLSEEWKELGFHEQVSETLKSLQKIRIGTLDLGANSKKNLIMKIPKNLNDLIGQIGVSRLFKKPPAWACS